MPLHVSSTYAHHQEVRIALHSLWYHHTYRCDDARGCVMQFWPPDDEHMCSKHVEAWNKLIVKQKFCASSWLFTEINECSLLGHWMMEFLQTALRSNTLIAETETGFCWPKVLRRQKSGRQSAVITVRPTNTFLGIYNNRYKPEIRPKYGSFPYRYQNKQLRLPGMNNTHTGIMKCTL